MGIAFRLKYESIRERIRYGKKVNISFVFLEGKNVLVFYHVGGDGRIEVAVYSCKDCDIYRLLTVTNNWMFDIVHSENLICDDSFVLRILIDNATTI